MRFAYMIMAEDEISDELAEQLKRPNVDVFLLTWRTPVDGAIFFPKSTWTEGRNRLFQEVKDLDYDYYVFMDEDVAFSKPLEVFEGLLEKYRPVVGVPLYPAWPDLYENISEGEVSTQYTFDAICTAIRKDALQTLLPYNPVGDAQSWHLSQLYFIHLSRVCYPYQVAHFNDVSVENLLMREYPRKPTLVDESDAFGKTIKEGYRERFRECWDFAPTGEFLADGQSACLDDCFDMDSEYWQSYSAIRESLNDSFNPESVRWEAFHKTNGSAATIHELGGLPEKKELYVEPFRYHQLGDDYYHGRNGKDKDDVKAVECWLKGAKLGNLQCMENIAWAYENGIGADKDIMRSGFWANQVLTEVRKHDINSDTAVVVHLYYVEMLDELCRCLDELRRHMDFDVFVTTQANYADIATLREITKRLKVKDFQIVENRGRDVLPFLKMLPKLTDYEYVCKLHTKRDFEWRGPAQHLHDQGWREHMWLTITDPVIVKKAKEAMDDGFGLYAPKTFWFDGHPECFAGNHKNLQRLGEFLDKELKSESFVSGTMFWFKPSALAWLLDYDLDGLFEPEDGSKDGKMEHAFERCFHQLAKHANTERFYREYEIKQVSVESLLESFKMGLIHSRGDEAYHRGDLAEARRLWTEGAELGSEQCKKNLETCCEGYDCI